MIAALLPVKLFAQSKQRLAKTFPPAAREALARAMFDDTWQTLRTLRARGALEQLLVVTAEPHVLARCAEERIPCLREREQVSHSESVGQATRWAMGQGVTTLLSLAMDTPGATAEELSALLALARLYAVVIVPSADGSGTNALLRTPPDAIAPRFGPGSLALHVQAAAAQGLPHLVYRTAGLTADIDTPQDVDSFLALNRPSATAGLLKNLLSDRYGVSVCR